MLDQLNNLYLFHLMVLLNPAFNCSNNLLSSSVDRVTTGTYSFTSVITDVPPVGALVSGIGGLTLGLASCIVSSVTTQFLDHVKIRFTS